MLTFNIIFIFFVLLMEKIYIIYLKENKHIVDSSY